MLSAMANISHSPSLGGKRQQGIVLVMALIFLVVLTVLGLSASGTAGIEALMAGSFRDRDRAFAAAEMALRDAEIRISGYHTNPATPLNAYAFPDTGAAVPCVDGLCSATVTQPLYSHDFYSSTAPGSGSAVMGVWAASNANRTPDISGLASQPRYAIESACRSVPGESLTEATCQTVFRITAQAQGNKASTRLTLQETYVP